MREAEQKQQQQQQQLQQQQLQQPQLPTNGQIPFQPPQDTKGQSFQYAPDGTQNGYGYVQQGK